MRLVESWPWCGAEWKDANPRAWDWVQAFLRLAMVVSKPDKMDQFEIRLEVGATD